MDSRNPEFVISRVFDAPKNVVYKAWTDSSDLKQWWGPKGTKVTECTLDLKPNGTLHYCLKPMFGPEMWGKFVFKEILPQEKLTFINCFSDKNGGITRHPYAANWPLELMSVVSFTEESGKTKLSVTWTPINSNDQELKAFEEGQSSMQQGWTGTLDQLTEFLKNSLT
jgi:uncharacterized protein YndB with AHSA1/START domain